MVANNEDSAVAGGQAAALEDKHLQRESVCFGLE